MDIFFPVTLTAGAVLFTMFLIILIVASVKSKKSKLKDYDSYQEESEKNVKGFLSKEFEDEKVGDVEISKRIGRKISDPIIEEEHFGVIGRDALKGGVTGPWSSVIASIISANRGVSREHLGYAPVTQILNEIAPTNRNVTIDLDRDELQDFLSYVKILETSLKSSQAPKKGITPQEKYRMLQRAFEDKRDLDTTAEARKFSREVIRQEKMARGKLLSDEQLAKLDKEISERVDKVLEDNPEAQIELDDFKEDLKGRGLKSRKKVKIADIEI